MGTRSSKRDPVADGTTTASPPWRRAISLETTENTLIFGGYAAAALVIGTVLLYRRDN